MTTITGGATGATNVFDSDALKELASAPLGTHSSTQFVISNSDFQVTGIGTGLSYSGGHPSAGTITSLTVTVFGFTSTWSGFSISASSLWHAVSAGDAATFDSLLFGGNDTFNSGVVGSNSDNIAGYAGDDVFNMGASFRPTDRIDGGTGNDTIHLDGDYSGGVTLFPSNIVSVENITLAVGHTYALSIGNSSTPLSGTLNIDASALGAANFVNFDGGGIAGTAAFHVTGGAGNDIFRGGAGNDTFDGGAGNDVVNYSSSSDNLTINIGTSGPQTIGQGFGTDTLISVEGVITGVGNDTITGDGHDNTIDAGGGNNTIDGGAGNDTVSYASTPGSMSIDLSLTTQSVSHNSSTDQVTSVENVVGTAQNDTIIAGNNDNVIDGGFGGELNDTLSYIHATSGVTIDYSTGTGTGHVTGGSGHDMLTNIGDIVGSGFDDTLIVGLSPHSQSGGFEIQFFDGGAGNDTLDFSHLTAGVNMNNPGVPGVTNVELLIGTSFADVMSAPSISTGIAINGGGGDDQLTSLRGDQTLDGGDGNDALQLGAFDNTNSADGGAGTDVLSVYVQAVATVVLGANTIQNVETVHLDGPGIELRMNDGNVAAGKTMTMSYALGNPNATAFSVQVDAGAETDGTYVFSTDAGNDKLTGGAGNDTFNTAAGADTIDISHGGDDTVNAGAGNDTIVAGAALTVSDTIDGGADSDTLTLNGDYSAGFTFHTTTLVNVEAITLAVGHSYKLTTIDATVAAGASMTVDGGALHATDALTFDGSRELDGTFALKGGAGADTLTGGKGNDTIKGGDGNDVIAGGAGTDNLQSGNGDDTFNLASTFDAADRVDGGAGNDTVSLAGDYSAGVTFSATTLTGVETLKFGTQHSYKIVSSDTTVAAGATLTVNASALTATDSANFDGSHEQDGSFAFTDGAGNDVFAGGKQADTFNLYHGGNDTAFGNGGNDTFLFRDMLSSGDTVDGGNGNDTVTLQGDYTSGFTFGATALTSVETISLVASHSYNLTTNDANVAASTTLTVDGHALHATDTLVFNGAAEADGKFIVNGGNGNDTLTGGLGDDTIYAGLGADHLNGGGGSDHFVYKTAAQSTGASFDTVTGFDATTDAFDLPFLVKHLNTAVNAGSLSAATFDSDLATALNAAHLGTHHAVLFTASAGDFAGDTFLVVDINNTAGYQAGADLVIRLDAPAHLDALGTGDFI